MRHIFRHTAHRPYPHPTGPWVMRQTWENLLFAHWPIPSAVMRPLIPAGLELDTWDGYAWVGVVPFAMRDVYPRATFAVPGLSHFLELNVRTYVRHGDRAGVWFFSLDAANPIAVQLARALFHLPYFDAEMHLTERAGWVEYLSVRTHRGAPPAALRAHYRPTGPAYHASPGSMEAWLTERYCLYAQDGAGALYRGEIHHAPWPLQPAELRLFANTMLQAHGLPLSLVNPKLHFARRIDVAVWPLVTLP